VLRQLPRHLRQARIEANLLRRLPQGRGFGALARLDPPAREGDLPGMGRQIRRAQRESTAASRSVGLAARVSASSKLVGAMRASRSASCSRAAISARETAKLTRPRGGG
jgi:hypothetical protein